MADSIATARACSNIAFIKYWGNRDDLLRLPANGSISMNLAGVETITTVRFSDSLERDRLFLNGQARQGDPLARVSRQLDHLRQMAAKTQRAEIISQNNFPAGTGVASSASAFAALTVAAAAALDLTLGERMLSALARLGSGSACRSVPGGFVEWYTGDQHETSFAETIAPPGHWDLIDLIAIISHEHKAVGSTEGHALASTSPLQVARVADAPRRLAMCREAIIRRDFALLAEIVEQDALMMHAVMMTSHPPLIYWLPPTLKVVEMVRAWRDDGIPVCFTIDAGPNVHVISTSAYADVVESYLAQLEGVTSVLVGKPGGPAQVLPHHLTPPAALSGSG